MNKKIYLLVYFFISFIFALFVYFDFIPFGSNYIAPDSYNLLDVALNDEYFNLIDIYEHHRSAVLFLFINKIIANLSVYAFYFVNLLIFLYSFFNKNTNAKFSSILIFLLPLFLVNLPLPSKDLWALFLFGCWLIVLSNNGNGIYLLILSLFLSLFRDGFGYILFMCSIFLMFNLNKINNLMSLFGALIISFFMDFVVKKYSSDIFLFQRVLYIAENTEIQNYFVRFFGNIFNFATRNPIFTEIGELNILFISYLITGVTFVSAFLVSFLFVNSDDLINRKIASVFFLIVIISSISPLVQSRYMMVLCIVLVYYRGLKIKTFFYSYIISIVLCIFISVFYNLFGFSPDLAPSENFHINKLIY